jgi:anti-sigma regulatory factor (Ser/Thr protein kinase)
MCKHQLPCPDALATDRIAARAMTSHLERGWSLLYDGVVLLADAGALLPGKPGSSTLIDDPPGKPRAARRKDGKATFRAATPGRSLEAVDVVKDDYGLPPLHPGRRCMNYVPRPRATCPNPSPSHAPTRTPPAQCPRTTRLELAAVSTAAGRARATVRAALAEWGLAALTGDAEAVTSELVANAIAASQQAAPAGTMPAPIWLTITATTELFIDIWDPCLDPPLADYVPGTWDENGRGLLIVNALSHRWGWYHPNGHGGKIVWAALNTSQ